MKNGNGTDERKKSKDNCFDPDDNDIIDELVEEGWKATDISDLFDGKYTWQKIAAYKASQTRSKNEEGGNGLDALKEEIRARDNYTCQYPGCGMTNEENLKKRGHQLHVHHLDYNDKNNDEKNLISLCTSCHAKTNTVQYAEEMKLKLEARIEKIYMKKTGTN